MASISEQEQVSQIKKTALKVRKEKIENNSTGQHIFYLDLFTRFINLLS